MRKPVSARVIGAGLVCAHVTLAGAGSIALITAWRGPPRGYDDALFAIALAIAISQASLIGLWAGLAKAPAARRSAAAIGGGAAVYITLTVAALTAEGAGTSDSEDWVFPAVFVFGPLVAVGLFAAALRRRRFVVERLAPGENSGERRDVQFSLFHLFAITFVAAILFTLVRQLRAVSTGEPTPWQICLLAAFNALVFLLHTQICLWSALCAGRLVARVSVLLFSTALAGAVYGLASGGRPNDYRISIELISAYSIVTAGSLLVLRRFGYCLMRGTAPGSADALDRETQS